MLQKNGDANNKKLIESIMKFPGDIEVVALCAGSEVQEVVGSSLLATLEVGKEYNTVLVAENDPKKRTFIKQIVQAGKRNLCCFAKDMADVSTAQNEFTCMQVVRQSEISRF